MRRGETPDEQLHVNAGYLGLTALTLPPAMGILYLFAMEDPILPPVFVWLFSVVLVTFYQTRKPYYPFRLWLMITPADGLTVDQRKVLAFLKGPEANRLAFYVGAVMSGFVVLTVLLAQWNPFDFKVSFAEPPPAHLVGERIAYSILGGFLASFFNILAVLFAHVGITCWYVLRHWDRVQATYSPWPIPSIKRDFAYGGPDVSQAAEGEPAVTRVRLNPVWRKPISTPLTFSQVCRFFSGLLGALLLGIGLLVIRDQSVPILTKLLFIGPGAALLYVGSRLWGRR